MPCIRPAIATLTFAALIAIAPPLAAQTPADTTRFDRLLQFRIDPPAPCVHDSIRITARDLCGICTSLESFTVLDDGPSSTVLELKLASAVDGCPPELCRPEDRSVTLAPKDASPNDLAVVRVTVALPPDSLHPEGGTISFLRSWQYAVSDTCTVPVGPTAPDFVRQIAIMGAIAPCDTCPPVVCAGGPWAVTVAGTMPDACWQFEGARLDDTPTLVAEPPTIDVTFRHLLGIGCDLALQPFTATVAMPPAASGRFPFRVRQVFHNTADSSVTSTLKQYTAEGDDCPPPQTCVWPTLIPASRDSLGCAAHLFPGGHGTVEFVVHSEQLPLAGLQGAFRAAGAVAITGVRAIGPAEGMHLVLQKQQGGIGFVLYADSGAPIPAGASVPVLEVAVDVDSAASPGVEAIVNGSVTAASDSLARSVAICPFLPLVVLSGKVCIDAPSSCDANGDQVTNVADLVGMAQCAADPAHCHVALPDCNENGGFDLEDILCCARKILGGGTGGVGHDAARLHFSFGTPTTAYDKVTVPLRVSGATEMNGALLRVRFPGDRYEIDRSEVSSVSNSTPWLPLQQGGYDDVVLGILRLDSGAPDDLTVPLHLVLRPGQAAGGAVTIDQGSIMSPDGSALHVDLAQVTGTLPGLVTNPIDHVELLAGPNPTSGVTYFTLRLPAPANVDLSIYDLAGRRVATAWHGSRSAGGSTITWDGRALRGGIYFARLMVDGTARTRRVVLQHAR
jgi:hypothetical protein